MKHLRKYEEFNLDLSRMLKAGIQRRGYCVQSLSEALGFSAEWVAQITERPTTVPCCDFSKMVDHLDLVPEYYEAYFREIERATRRHRPQPTLH